MFDLLPFRRRRELAESIFNPELVKEFFGSNLLKDMEMNIRADIKENEKEYIVEAELPGVKKDEIIVEFKQDMMIISAEHKEEFEEEKDNYVRKERKHGKISRSFYIVQKVNHEGITADYKDGILKIVLPKVEESAPDSYQVEIK